MLRTFDIHRVAHSTQIVWALVVMSMAMHGQTLDR